MPSTATDSCCTLTVRKLISRFWEQFFFSKSATSRFSCFSAHLRKVHKWENGRGPARASIELVVALKYTSVLVQDWLKQASVVQALSYARACMSSQGSLSQQGRYARWSYNVCFPWPGSKGGWVRASLPEGGPVTLSDAAVKHY